MDLINALHAIFSNPLPSDFLPTDFLAVTNRLSSMEEITVAGCIADPSLS
jgi:hypothetical protein